MDSDGSAMKPIYILNGPNLNMLGLREPDVYGQETITDLEARCAAKAKALGTDRFPANQHRGRTDRLGP